MQMNLGIFAKYLDSPDSNWYNAPVTNETEQLFLFLKDFAQHNQDSFEPEQIEILLRAADVIRQLDEAVDSLIVERDNAYEQIDRYKQGFEGCCTACEPVALRNQELLRERDEARRAVCFLTVFDPEVSHLNYDDSEREEARSRGWDCFKTT